MTYPFPFKATFTDQTNDNNSWTRELYAARASVHPIEIYRYMRDHKLFPVDRRKKATTVLEVIDRVEVEWNGGAQRVVIERVKA